MREYNNVEACAAKQVQRCCSHYENKKSVERCCIKCLMEIKLRLTLYSMMQHGGQTSSTCCIQQCLTKLNRDVAIRLSRV